MSTPSEPQESSVRPVGPHPEFGLLAWLEGTRIQLPLKGVECRFETAGDLAHVTVDQIYHQTADRALECTYVFPLPADAAVHRCEFDINGRVIRARIEEAHQARLEYEAARSAGHRAVLVESNRPNLFTLSLANVQPQDR
ncbi:MAG: hypothetical protein J0L84_08010 [Verrucomicrobia bacterium]|nr:hypothetical protein [Verrucomicrobiota bacterium]